MLLDLHCFAAEAGEDLDYPKGPCIYIIVYFGLTSSPYIVSILGPMYLLII